MPNPFANTGGGPGGADDGFLGLDSGNFWSRFGLPTPGAGQNESNQPMGPADITGPEIGSPSSELEPTMPDTNSASAPLDALYSMIGMSPLQADSMGRYNLTDDQKQSSSKHALAGTLGAAAKVMFGTGGVDQMVNAGVGYGDRRDASLDKFSATNKADYDTKVDMALKGSNLLRQQTVIEAEQEKLKEIMDQKEFGAHWAETMQPVWEKYANKVAEIDPDKAKEYAATLTMVKAKALSGDMAGATLMFDTATKAMVPGQWEEDIKEDIVRAQFAKSAEFSSFAEADKALQQAMPGWKMGMVQGKPVPMSPADQQREANAIDVLAAQASNYREQNGGYAMQNTIVRAQIAENKRISELAQKGSGALKEALELAGTSGDKPNEVAARANAQQAFGEYIPYLQSAGALGNDPSKYMDVLKVLVTNPGRLQQAIANGARSMSTVYQTYGDPNGGGQQNPAQRAGAGPAPQGGQANLGALMAKLNEGIASIGMPGGADPAELLDSINMIPDPGAREAAKKAVADKLAGKNPTRVYAAGGQGAYRVQGNSSAQ